MNAGWGWFNRLTVRGPQQLILFMLCFDLFISDSNGLGISIVGSGVDTSNGEQKLGIFIRALTPGGAAEADGR